MNEVIEQVVLNDGPAVGYPELGAVEFVPTNAAAIAILDQIEQHVRDYGAGHGGELSEKLTELRAAL